MLFDIFESLYGHINPYGNFRLNMNERMAKTRFCQNPFLGSNTLYNGDNINLVDFGLARWIKDVKKQSRHGFRLSRRFPAAFVLLVL
ncbi:MAG: hypothetical protein Q8942_16885 [Bacillota bacterium]|nr:hypothetical protein [Bacillota bacterium]